jgi:hypothetical protein
MSDDEKGRFWKLEKNRMVMFLTGEAGEGAVYI